MLVDKVAENIAEYSVLAIIPTYNRWSEAFITLSCLTHLDYPNLGIALIEDACTDDTVENCKKLFPDVTILHGNGKFWWSGAINKGIDYALSRDVDLILWLNDDTRIESQALTRLVEAYRLTDGRRIISGRVKSTGSGEDEWIGEPPIWSPQFGEWSPPDLSSKITPLSHPPGGRGVLIPAQCFREVGMIDQKTFPHYWADHDFHYRAMKAGYQYYLATQAIIWNVPNAEYVDAPEKFSLPWAVRFLFNRRSPMNMLTLRRLLKRHLKSAEYQAVYYSWLKRTLTWLMSGWASRKPLVHSSLRAIRRNFMIDKRNS